MEAGHDFVSDAVRWAPPGVREGRVGQSSPLYGLARLIGEQLRVDRSEMLLGERLVRHHSVAPPWVRRDQGR